MDMVWFRFLFAVIVTSVVDIKVGSGLPPGFMRAADSRTLCLPQQSWVKCEIYSRCSQPAWMCILLLTVGVLYLSATSATARKNPAYKPNWEFPFCNREWCNCNSATVVQQKKRNGFLSVQAVFKALPQLPQKISGTVHYLLCLEFIERHISTVLSRIANGNGVAALRGFYQSVLGKCF